MNDARRPAADSPGTGSTDTDSPDTGSPDAPVSDRHTVFSPPRGGVMTAEVGVITGELELHTTADPKDGGLTLRVRYAGAAEWYTAPGGPYRLHDPRDHEVVHDVLVNLLHRDQP
ncbi:hypothetical protein ACTWP5_18365 [Streptomyces sp. 4N509B]|uniref:hypothetical protein n=1 Tax=Streptomyces sp. 4N509B TaxID=3457413 RepID=UPI003FD3BE81